MSQQEFSISVFSIQHFIKLQKEKRIKENQLDVIIDRHLPVLKVQVMYLDSLFCLNCEFQLA